MEEPSSVRLFLQSKFSRLLQRSPTSDAQAPPEFLPNRSPAVVLLPPFQTGRCCAAVSDFAAITINSLLFVPNESCFRCGLPIDWSRSPGNHSDGTLVFSREFTQSSRKKRKNISNLFRCLARFTHYSGSFSILKKKLISQQI